MTVLLEGGEKSDSCRNQKNLVTELGSPTSWATLGKLPGSWYHPPLKAVVGIQEDRNGSCQHHMHWAGQSCGQQGLSPLWKVTRPHVPSPHTRRADMWTDLDNCGLLCLPLGGLKAEPETRTWVSEFISEMVPGGKATGVRKWRCSMKKHKLRLSHWAAHSISLGAPSSWEPSEKPCRMNVTVVP